jgi:hypothetical protein
MSWQWDGQADGLIGTDRQQLVVGARTTTGDGSVLLMTGGDAFLEIPVPTAILGDLQPGSHLIVRLSWPMSDDYRALADRLPERHEGAADAARASAAQTAVDADDSGRTRPTGQRTGVLDRIKAWLAG